VLISRSRSGNRFWERKVWVADQWVRIQSVTPSPFDVGGIALRGIEEIAVDRRKRPTSTGGA